VFSSIKYSIMTDKEIMKNNPLETEQQSAQEIENIKQ
jgi:hypothetical protein